MAGARRSTFDAISKTIADIKPPGARFRFIRASWSWRSTGDPGMFELRRDGTAVGELSLLPGHVERRAVLLDQIIDYLNKETNQ